MPGVSGEARGDYARTLFYFACEAAGALKRPAFPAPSDIGGTMSWHHPGGIASREGGGMSKSAMPAQMRSSCPDLI